MKKLLGLLMVLAFLGSLIILSDQNSDINEVKLATIEIAGSEGCPGPSWGIAIWETEGNYSFRDCCEELQTGNPQEGC